MLLDTASMYFRAFYGVPDRCTRRTARRSTRCAGCSTSSPRLVTDYRPDAAGRAAGTTTGGRRCGSTLHPVVQGAPRGRTAVPARRRRGGAGPARRRRCRSSSRCWPRSASPASGRAGYEADDVIGTLATGAGEPGRRGHRRPRPVPARRRRRRRAGALHRRAGSASSRWSTSARCGRSTASPAAQYADFAALRGDPSDGLPGVPGVGEKTAAGAARSAGARWRRILAALDSGDPALTQRAEARGGPRLPGGRRVR